VRTLRRIIACLTVVAVGCTDSTTPEVVVETTVVVRVERATGFDGEIVRFAVLADLSGPGAHLDRPRVAGIETYWASVNALGGFDGRFAVELLVLDHGGDPARAVTQLAEVIEDVMAVAFVSESVVDGLVDSLEVAGVLSVPGSATADLEAHPLMLTHGLPIEATLVSLFDALADATWCVVADPSPLGARIAAAAAPSSVVTSVAAPAVYDVGGPDLTTSLADAPCSHVYVEVHPASMAFGLATVPAGRTVVYRSVPGHGFAIDEGVESYIVDDASEWRDDASTGMADLVADLAIHSPDADPDPRLRAGYASQIQLDAIVTAGFASGDVRRKRLDALVEEVGRVDMRGLAGDVDRSVEPPEYPRQLRLFALDPSGDELGWSFVDSHRAPQVGVLLAEVVSAG
jgi:hypothetical protein